MCGIFGVIRSKRSETELKHAVEHASKVLKHRGPDSNGVISWYDAETGYTNCLSHHRLAIVDPGSEPQPLIGCSESGEIFGILSVNGEIYNHKTLRQKTTYRYKTGSDSECIVGLVHEKVDPVTIPAMLDGKFAYILSTPRTGYTYIARDPYGVLPLYIGFTEDMNGEVIISSELKAIYEYNNSATILDFPPGHSAKFGPYGFAVERYSHTIVKKYNMIKFEDEFITALSWVRGLLMKSVEKRLMCDVPFGVLLSGGLDSSLIASIATREYRKRVGDPHARLHTFSVGMADSPDLKSAREVARHINSHHHELVLKEKDVIDAIQDAVYYLETFDVASIRSGIPMMLLARYISKLHIPGYAEPNSNGQTFKMVLNGDGSDELFAGYAYFKWAPDSKSLHEETVRKLATLYKYDCLRANKAMMAGSIECRCPFLDRDLVDCVLRIHPNLKQHRYTHYMFPETPMEKYLLRCAFYEEVDKMLPDSILWRSKVQFSVGCGDSLIKTLQNYCNHACEYLDVKYTQKKPQNNEALYYRYLYEKMFSPTNITTVSYYPSMNCSTREAVEWLPEEMKGRIDPCGTSFYNG